MKKLVLLFVSLMLVSCANVSTYTPRESPSRVERSEVKRTTRSSDWLKEHCPDCGGNGPKHVTMKDL